MKTLAAFIAGAVLAAAGTAGADGGHLRDVLDRVGVVEAHQDTQDAQIAELQREVKAAMFAAEQADSAAAWALENSWSEARSLRKCGMKPTIRKQNQCFFRLF